MPTKQMNDFLFTKSYYKIEFVARPEEPQPRPPMAPAPKDPTPPSPSQELVSAASTRCLLRSLRKGIPERNRLKSLDEVGEALPI